MPIFHLKPTPRRSYGDLRLSGRPPKKRRSWSTIKLLIKAALAGAVLLFIGGTFLILWTSRDLPDPNKLKDRQVAQSTKIYDRTGEHLLYEVYQDQRRTMVELEQMSPWLPKAVVAIEDKHFYEHSGIRITSIMRAIFNNVIQRRTGAGGASTITQQLIKNTMIGNKPSFVQKVTRKLKEFILAPQLEKKYTKDQILKMYLNEIPLGSTNYGVESASQSYFKKNAKDLTLGESAMLAALIQAPSRYLNNLDVLKSRRDYILKLMLEQEFINEKQKTDAQAEELKLTRYSLLSDAPHFVLYIKQQLAEKYGELVVDTGGLKVITALDYDKQKIAELAVKELGDKFAKEANASNAALVALDPKTGQILAYIGSRDFNNDEIDGKFDIVAFGKRQPGSSFKPFVYTAAFEKGFTPDTVLYDVKTNFEMRTGAKPYIPNNYDGKDHGLVTMRKALQGSLNIPAVKTMYLVGMTQTTEFAKRFGYTSFDKDPDLTMVLGGTEVNLLEHTNAFAALANNGTLLKPSGILKVTNLQGDILEEWRESEGTEAVKPELAALITSVLTDNNARAFIFGQNNYLTLPGRPVATKTGTTNDNKDAWTLGYTPSLVSGVWVGNTPTSSPMKMGGNKLAGSIWNRFMTESLKKTPAETFPEPPANDATKPVLRGSADGIKLRINQLTGRIASSSTPDELVMEKTFLPPHDILHYVNKDDPRGPEPTNPTDDPQYQNWETALLEWVERERKAGREISFEAPPTEYDTETSPELAPTIQIISPTSNETIATRQFTIRVNASAPRGVAQVTFYLDEQSLGTSSQFPFSWELNLPETNNGWHTLRAVAMDDLGNNTAQQIQINLQAEMAPSSVDWIDPSPLQLSASDFPRAMYLNTFRWSEVKQAQIYLNTLTEKKLIYTFKQGEELVGKKLMFTWNHSPGNGNFTLSAIASDNSGRTSTKDLQVEVR